MQSRLRFSAPVGPVMAAVAIVALVIVALFIIGPGAAGPAATQSAAPSASASATPAEPTPTPQPTATPQPTPTATPGVAAWTSLDWVAGSTTKGKWLQFNDVLLWGARYVGVGSSAPWDLASPASRGPMSPAFFTSADGLHWTIAQEGEPISNDYQSPEDLLPMHLVPIGGKLLAVGRSQFGGPAPLLWSTGDGSTWAPLENASWTAALTGNTLISVASGPTGVVVIGAEGTMCCANPQGPPLIIHSADGVTWDQLALSSVFDNAYPTDLTAYAGGFAIVGRVGDQQVRDPTPAVGRPAAWTSADGVTWEAATVEGAEGLGAGLRTVAAASNGLFATGRQVDTGMGGETPLSGWASPDGRSWRLLGEVGTDLPLAIGNPAMVLGDGQHLVMFGRESCKTGELSAWTSLDGMEWTKLAFTGSTLYRVLIPGPICMDDGTEGWSVGSPAVAYVALLPHGVFLITASSAPTAPSPWFLAATTE